MIRFSHKNILLLMALVGLVLISACGNGGDDQNTADADHQVSDAVIGGEKGNQAPEFDLQNLAGGQLTLSSLRGKAVIIDFWDTWCPPCRKALPHLEAVSQAYADDLVVVGVAFGRDGEAKVRQYVDQNHLTFPMVLADKEFQIARDYGGVQSIPTTFLIDRNGIIVEKWVGGHGREEYEAAVKKVLGS